MAATAPRIQYPSRTRNNNRVRGVYRPRVNYATPNHFKASYRKIYLKHKSLRSPTLAQTKKGHGRSPAIVVGVNSAPTPLRVAYSQVLEHVKFPGGRRAACRADSAFRSRKLIFSRHKAGWGTERSADMHRSNSRAACGHWKIPRHLSQHHSTETKRRRRF
ncbi:hypothetical protein ACJJTC_019509 [Scirpophaga incertulas]